ncbi:MAG: UDP-N-acetylmuramate dehydrogenase [Candidatus Omnitrophica bacterium]|nr:UDP-N-acetylmuramate dehydrogenase [Candidatus Omnitrophota bacterium]
MSPVPADAQEWIVAARDLAHALEKLGVGVLRLNEPLYRHMSLRIGGPAALWVEPRSVEALCCVIQEAKYMGLPLAVLGGGTNTCVADYGFPGVVVHLGNETFGGIERRGSDLHVGAAAPLAELVRRAASWGLGGCEGLAGIPGQVGGAVAGNAGTRSDEGYVQIGDCVQWARGLDENARLQQWGPDNLGFEYRNSSLSKTMVIQVGLRMREENSEDLKKRVQDLCEYKTRTQEYRLPSAGCWFKNPKDCSAAQLIERSGLKGLKAGTVQVCPAHANFITLIEGIPRGRSDDLLGLVDQVTRRVKQDHGVELKSEVRDLWNQRWW